MIPEDPTVLSNKEWRHMFYGLDAHKRFIQVCKIDSEGRVCGESQVAATPEAIQAFARGLGADDQVVLEATFHTWAIWSLLRPHAGKVVVANPIQVKAIAHARIKTDKIDARILAQLLRVNLIPEVVMPDDETWQVRQLVAHRRFLGKRLVAVKNTVRGVLNRKLLMCPYVELFQASGRRWLGEQSFTETEGFVVSNSLGLHDELVKRVSAVDEKLRMQATVSRPSF